MTINTLYELVRNSVEKFASKVAFSMFEGDDVTYAEDGPLYLDELGYFKGMQGMRFYRLDELVSLFAEGA